MTALLITYLIIGAICFSFFWRSCPPDQRRISAGWLAIALAMVALWPIFIIDCEC